jgi:NAD(P)H-hydrate epimerase
LRVVDIGIPPALVSAAESAGEATLAPDVRPFLGRMLRSSHKGTMGRIAIVGGSRQYPNAPILAATAALRAGGGLVTMAVPQSALPLLGPAPNAIIPRLLEDAPFAEWLPSQDVVAVGPGLGRSDSAANILRQVLAVNLPTVIDADGLAAIPECRQIFPRSAPTILTPHPGEMRRLADALGVVATDRLVQAATVAEKLGVVVVLKGADSIVAEPYGTVATNTSGSPALATAGSGDVLTGLTAAWMHVADSTFAAAQAAVFVHGLAGELAPCGVRNLIADDLPELIGQAMHTLSPFA